MRPARTRGRVRRAGIAVAVGSPPRNVVECRLRAGVDTTVGGDGGRCVPAGDDRREGEGATRARLPRPTRNPGRYRRVPSDSGCYFFRPNFFSSFARVFGSLALRIALSFSFWPFGEFANLANFLPNLPMIVLLWVGH